MYVKNSSVSFRYRVMLWEQLKNLPLQNIYWEDQQMDLDLWM